MRKSIHFCTWTTTFKASKYKSETIVEMYNALGAIHKRRQLICQILGIFGRSKTNSALLKKR